MCPNNECNCTLHVLNTIICKYFLLSRETTDNICILLYSVHVEYNVLHCILLCSDCICRDIFGIGGYDDSPTNRLKIDDMLETLRFAVEGGNFFLPEIYRELRRRDRLLRNNMMYMGSLTAFADYFPLWTTATDDPQGPGGRRCDICKALAPPVSTRRGRTTWM